MICFLITVLLEGIFVWLATKVVRLGCTYKEAIIIASVCTALLLVPKIGLILSIIAFVTLLMKWMRADAQEAFLISMVHCILNLLFMFVGLA